jgi:hypothetical protein
MQLFNGFVGPRSRLALLALLVLAAAACSKKEPEFEGTFAGKVEEKFVEQQDGTTINKPISSETKENVTFTITKGPELAREVSLGDCKIQMLPNAREGKGSYATFNEEKKICKLSVGGYTGDFIMSASGSVTRNLKSGEDMLICSIGGYSVELRKEYPNKSKYAYTYTFNGDRK